jgi:hypothetical protein
MRGEDSILPAHHCPFTFARDKGGSRLRFGAPTIDGVATLAAVSTATVSWDAHDEFKNGVASFASRLKS